MYFHSLCILYETETQVPFQLTHRNDWWCPFFLQIVAEEPNKNYFNPLMAIPKNVNAIWELIRSFIISFSKEYKEGWFLRAYRLLGLIVPGVAAHGPQDYVNSTRLGSSALLLPHQIPLK